MIIVCYEYLMQLNSYSTIDIGVIGVVEIKILNIIIPIC